MNIKKFLFALSLFVSASYAKAMNGGASSSSAPQNYDYAAIRLITVTRGAEKAACDMARQEAAVFSRQELERNIEIFSKPGFPEFSSIDQISASLKSAVEASLKNPQDEFLKATVRQTLFTMYLEAFRGQILNVLQESAKNPSVSPESSSKRELFFLFVDYLTELGCIRLGSQEAYAAVLDVLQEAAKRTLKQSPK